MLLHAEFAFSLWVTSWSVKYAFYNLQNGESHVAHIWPWFLKWINFMFYKTDVGRRQTLGHPRSINPNMINHVPQQSPLIFEVIYYMLSVHEAITISYSYHLPSQGSRNCQNQMSATTRLLTWFGRLSNTAHPYSKSISIIKMYCTINIDS